MKKYMCSAVSMSADKSAMASRVLFVNGHIWQWRERPDLIFAHDKRERAPPASWVLISSDGTPDDDDDGRRVVSKHDGRILDLGNGDVPAEHREGSQMIDLGGALMLPGLHDAHIHVGSLGESARYVDLSDCHSVSEVQRTIREHARGNPDLPWVIGTGWDQNLWSPPKSLTRVDLDDSSSLPADRPCLLYRRCWHSAVANTAAMRAAGIDPDKPWSAPKRGGGNDGDGPGDGGEGGGNGDEGGGVELDDARRPTGLFRENSMRLVEVAVTAPSFETRCEQFAEALGRCVRSGLTAVHTNDENARDIYARLQGEGRVPVRVYLTLPHEELQLQEADGTPEMRSPKETTAETVAAAASANAADRPRPGAVEPDGERAETPSGKGFEGRPQPQQKAGEVQGNKVAGGGSVRATPRPWSGDGGLVSWHRVKLFADGSLGAETAAMRIPYVNTTNKGVLIHDQAALTEKVAQARRKGFRVEVHAIGDRALAAVLDAFSGAGVISCERPIITHCQVAGPDLRMRMREFGCVAAVQPSFVPSDAATVLKRLSPDVQTHCYPWRSLMRGGVTCAGSSDAPIETHAPLRGMYDAIFRPSKPSPASSAAACTDFPLERTPVAAPFLPDERLSLDDAVWIYTVGGAIAAGDELKLGSILPGYLADLTVLEVEGGTEKLLEDPSLFVEARVSQVWVGGSCKWNAKTSPQQDGGHDDEEGATGGGNTLGAGAAVMLGGSGMPGKNGAPKRERPNGGRRVKARHRTQSGGSGNDNSTNNIWLSGGLGRVGRCRCCS